jgi:hypothetical protein
LTDADWSGAKNKPLAKAVATLLRKKADRMRASEIHKKLPASVRPSSGGWFWFPDEPMPKHRDRADTPEAKERHKGDSLWWRIAHTIALLNRDFTRTEIEEACSNELKQVGKTWLRIRLYRARERTPPFVELISPGVFKWTGLSPSEVVVED